MRRIGHLELVVDNTKKSLGVLGSFSQQNSMSEQNFIGIEDSWHNPYKIKEQHEFDRMQLAPAVENKFIKAGVQVDDLWKVKLKGSEKENAAIIMDIMSDGSLLVSVDAFENNKNGIYYSNYTMKAENGDELIKKIGETYKVCDDQGRLSTRFNFI